ncbi:MAG: MFS transporter [Firmicutes bacterium]|nr:MFS transporter [Bacillota bacterium]
MHSERKRLNYKHTIFACYAGYVVQALIVNYVPLLYVTFQTEFEVSLFVITLLPTVCFGVQILTDLLASKVVDKVGYRISAVTAHILSALGLFSLAFLPSLINPIAGLIVSACLYAMGGGLIEVIVSPLVEACPTKKKESSMGLLHSFYCWGSVFVILVSTLLFLAFGISNWKIIACAWAIVPIANAVFFCFVPLYTLPSGDEKNSSFRSLAKNRAFWVLCLLMFCAGATEISVSQWASAFAEQGLGISKTLGDLAGPMAFAVLMGICRVFYAKTLNKISLEKFILISAVGCVGAYLLISLPPVAPLNLIGCALCGLFVGILWPGTFSTAAKALPYGGTMLFALLALAGDLGCTAGPTLVGFVSGLAGDNLQIGLLTAIIFPLLAILGIFLLPKKKKEPQLINPEQK